MTIKPILPVEVVRDEDGWFTHPQYFTEPEWEEVETFTREEFDSYCAERGIETATTDMESDDSEMHERYCEEGQVECTAWTPSKPVGDGWFMLSIHDTEDGPICVWGRRTEEPFVTEAVAAVSEPDLFSEQPAQHETESALQSLSHFTTRSFDQLMRYEDGRTPLYLTEEQYNAIRDLVAQASAAPEHEAVEALLLADCVEHRHPGYGGGYFGTNVVMLYTHADPLDVKILTAQRDSAAEGRTLFANECARLRQELSERDALLNRCVRAAGHHWLGHDLYNDICDTLAAVQPADGVKSDE